MNTYKDILRAEVVNMALEFVINLDAKKRLMQVIGSLPEESQITKRMLERARDKCDEMQNCLDASCIDVAIKHIDRLKQKEGE